jgi:hypothetical protein
MSGAREGDLPSSWHHQQFANRPKARIRGHTRECNAAVRIELWRPVALRGDALRCVAIHGALPEPFAAVQRHGVFRPNPEIALARVAKTRQTVQIADLRTNQGYLDREPLRRCYKGTSWSA